MRDTFGLFLMLVLTASAAAQTRDSNLAKPNLLLEQVVAGMPKSDKHMTTSQRVSNQKFKDATGWRPSMPSASRNDTACSSRDCQNAPSTGKS